MFNSWFTFLFKESVILGYKYTSYSELGLKNL